MSPRVAHPAPAHLGAVLAISLPWLASVSPAAAADVAVRFPEGMARGFLTLKDSSGADIADGRLLQVAKDGAVETRLLFRFRDGSTSEDTVAYTQDGVFRLVRFTQVQEGPAFPYDMHVSLDGKSGRYSVRSRPRGGKEEEELKGTLELPSDTYNGMIPIVVKDLPRGGEVHVVAFTPKPRILALQIAFEGEGTAVCGSSTLRTTRYLLKPQLGPLTKLVAKILGKLPPESHVWVVTEDVPAFLQFEGPLGLDGPVWRIEPALPRLSR